MKKADSSNIEKDLRYLTEKIGVRLAGSKNERLAAEYIAEEFRKTGASVKIEEFPVGERAVNEEKLHVKIGGKWKEFPCSLFGSSPGTDGKTIEAPLVFFEAVVDYQRKDLSYLKGKAVLHLGCHIENAGNYRKLMDAKPAFLLFVDIRYPGVLPLADGLFPAYVAEMGAKPTVNVAYMDAWNWKKDGASTAKLKVSGGIRKSLSTNVSAEFQGTGDGIIFTGSHHDTQAGTPGSDDNGSGVVYMLELARILSKMKMKRTVRLMSFGTEEQLSVGSAAYVRAHRGEIEKNGVFMFNVDSAASLLGWTEINFNGPEKLEKMLAPYFNRQDIYFSLTRDIIPYTDQFPFAVCGVPGLWLSRRNCAAGRFFHHRRDEKMDKVSPEILSRLVNAGAEFIFDMANVAKLPFKPEIPSELRQEIQKGWKDYFGGWKGLKIK